MAYARFGDGNVYMFGGTDGIHCRACSLDSRTPTFRRRSEALAHLEEHRRRHDSVPDGAFARLREEQDLWGDDARQRFVFEPWGGAGGLCRNCSLGGTMHTVRFDDEERALAHLLLHDLHGDFVPEELEPLLTRARHLDLDLVQVAEGDDEDRIWCLGCYLANDLVEDRLPDVELSLASDAVPRESARSHLSWHVQLGDPLDETARRILRERGHLDILEIERRHRARHR